jgi:hypothetical protein
MNCLSFLLSPSAAFFLVFLLIGLYSIHQLSRNRGDDIRVVWYLFSLSLVVTFGIALWAVDIDAINKSGSFNGTSGEMLKKLLDFMLDLNTDFKILLAIVTFIVLPQLLSYVLSGISGCASPPFLIERSWMFFIWGLVKSFAVCAGIIFSIAIFVIWKDWHDSWSDTLPLFYLSTMLVMLSFSTLFTHREAKTQAIDLKKNCPSLGNLFKGMHRWFTRHASSSD